MQTDNQNITSNITTAAAEAMAPDATDKAQFPAILAPENLKELGLRETDIPDIRTLAEQIRTESPATVAEYGQKVGEHTSNYADSLLEQVRGDELNNAGNKLGQIVAIARTLNVNSLSEHRSRIPVIGAFLDRFKLRAEAFKDKFANAREQIETLINEVGAMQNSISDRNQGLEKMHGVVIEEHRLLGLHIAAGRIRLGELQEEVNRKQAQLAGSNDPILVQEIADTNAVISKLDKRIGDLVALQHSAMQSLPTIRMIQANNQMLVDKFNTIQTLTIPAWKRQFLLAISLNEQKNAVTLATNIDDATNNLLRSNAELLYCNSVNSAKANQRLVIDVETLKTVHENLIKTVENVIQLQNEGVKERKRAENEIARMRDDLRNRLGKQQETAA